MATLSVCNVFEKIRCVNSYTARTCNTPCYEGISDDECSKACDCSDGYRRNSNGVCIPESECPSCKCPKNEWQVCSTECTKANSMCLTKCCGPLRNCLVKNCTVECDCKPGYRRDDKSRECVPENSCKCRACTPLYN